MDLLPVNVLTRGGCSPYIPAFGSKFFPFLNYRPIPIPVILITATTITTAAAAAAAASVPSGEKPLVGQGLLNVEASRSHSDTPHSVGLLWTSDQPDAETST
jgi:hypothetical protein